MTEPVVARKLNGERLVILSWSRAIALQMAHPLIATGVAQHSTFRGGAIIAARRAHGTIGAMRALTFGSDEQRASAIARIRGIHKTVHGTLPRAAGPLPAGTPYSAEDPQLLHWVHATLMDSIPDFYQRTVGPLSAAELDAFCAESVPTLIELGGDPARAPRTWRQVRGYMDDVYRSGVLTITPEAREIVGAVLNPRVRGLPFPGRSIHRLITIGLLPDHIREAYGYSWNDRRAKRLERVLRVVKTLRRVTPEFVARWPHARRRGDDVPPPSSGRAKR